MSRFQFTIDRVRTAAAERKKSHGIDPPRSVSRRLEQAPERLGPLGWLRLRWYLYAGGIMLRGRLLWYRLADRDTPGRRRRISRLADQLRPRLSAQCRVLEGFFERRLFSRDLATLPAAMEKLLFRTTPHLVVQLISEEDVLAALGFAAEHGLAVYPRGVSSSAFGGTVPTRNGLVIDLSRMAEIVSLDPDRMIVEAQPGVRWAALEHLLEHHGLCAVTHPSSRFSTIAGWACTGGLGLHSHKYGHLKEAVLAARVALVDGRVLSLSQGDPLLDALIGSEGRLGVITQLTLKVKPKPGFSRARLVTFENARRAFAFMDAIRAEGIEPSHMAFLDSGRLAEENRLFADRTGQSSPIVAERDAVLLFFDDREADERFNQWMQSRPEGRMEDGPAASYLWAERYFPLKAQRLGPNLLAAEAMLDAGATADYVIRAGRLIRRFGLQPAIEAIASRVDGEHRCVVIASFTTDARRRIRYFTHLALVQLLMRLAVRLGGAPYGVGIWNSAWARARVTRDTALEMERIKARLDPRGLLNPGKFPRVSTRFANMPAIIFIPQVFSGLLGVASAISLPLGLVNRAVSSGRNGHWTAPGLEEGNGIALLDQTSRRCTHCGSCIAICPAYLLTGDEMVTARAKLRLVDALINGEALEQAEASSPFQCIRCGLCEEVCQTRLPLRDCYEAIERLLSGRLGLRPDELVAGFIRTVDQNRDWIARTLGLQLADWSPREMSRSLPPGRIAAPGERP